MRAYEMRDIEGLLDRFGLVLVRSNKHRTFQRILTIENRDCIFHCQLPIHGKTVDKGNAQQIMRELGIGSEKEFAMLVKCKYDICKDYLRILVDKVQRGRHG